jgi:hypothetical protein
MADFPLNKVIFDMMGKDKGQYDKSLFGLKESNADSGGDGPRNNSSASASDESNKNTDNIDNDDNNYEDEKDDSRKCPVCAMSCGLPNNIMLKRIREFVKTFWIGLKATLSPKFARDKTRNERLLFVQEFRQPTSLVLEHHVQKPLEQWFPHLLLTEGK